LDEKSGLLSSGILGLASGLFVDHRHAQMAEEEAIQSVGENRRRSAFSTVALVAPMAGKVRSQVPSR